MISFYRDVLGLTPLESEYPPEEWQRFGTGGECELALHAISAPWRDGIEIGDPPEARRGAPSKVVLRVDELAPHVAGPHRALVDLFPGRQALGDPARAAVAREPEVDHVSELMEGRAGPRELPTHG